MTNKLEKRHQTGHRQRLKDRFMKEPAAVLDYELVELILFGVIPRKDVKPLAKDLFAKYGSFNKLMHLDDLKLNEFKPYSKQISYCLTVLREIFKRSLKEKIDKKNSLSTWPDLLTYLKNTMGHKNIEEFRVIFLNSQNIILADEAVSFGTIDQVVVYNREVISRAIFHNAKSIILVHNHPGGCSKPSKSDLILTKNLQDLCRGLNINLFDHIIVSSTNVYSFKSNNII